MTENSFNYFLYLTRSFSFSKHRTHALTSVQEPGKSKRAMEDAKMAELVSEAANKRHKLLHGILIIKNDVRAAFSVPEIT